MVIAIGVIAMTVAPTVLMGGMTANTLAMTHGSRVAHWWWHKLYRSKRLRIIFSDTHPDLYMLIMVIMAMKMEKKGYNTNTREMDIPPNTLYLLSDPNCPFHSDFFDQSGKRIRKHIYFPIKDFVIESTKIKRNNGHRGSTKLLICPISNGINVLGLDIWTYQWFWGGLGKTSIGPNRAKQALEKTIEEFKNFNGIDEKLEIISMATGKTAPLDQADINAINQYTVFYRHVLNPKSKASTKRKKLDRQRQTPPVDVTTDQGTTTLPGCPIGTPQVETPLKPKMVKV